MNFSILYLIFIYLIMFIIINKYIYKYKNNEYFVNKNIKKIINVYKEKYKNNKDASGFGDYLRGCYFLLQFTSDLNIDCNFIITHPISNYLRNNKKYNNISKIDIELNENYNNHKRNIVNNNRIISEYRYDVNFINKYTEYINNCDTLNGIILYTYTNAYPIYKIKQEHKLIIQQLIEPNDEMEKYIDENLQKINLKKKDYIIIHIRSGDKILLEKRKLSQNYTNKIINKINEILENNQNKNILLISDNDNLKKKINSIYNNIKSLNNNIVHFGEGSLLNNNNIKDTLLDMYLLSYSNYVYSLSHYEHGSGFCQWTSITYNIPYELYYMG